ncbi:hypothetical protein BDFB_011963 [Asbolus verrucosus]|uniref:Uncharacterized protein n=1 Tax=Asbolus verrucosus TaxID=1661398 RepID=A0A482WA69_ASBVE|nr:hypothetical protein BDFB_011963 [Asbolus verrucosus]
MSEGHFKRNPLKLRLSLRDWILTGESNPLKWICSGSFRECFLLGLFPGTSAICHISPCTEDLPVRRFASIWVRGDLLIDGSRQPVMQCCAGG